MDTNDTIDEIMHAASNTDQQQQQQLLLPVDVVGQLLLLLDVPDIQHLRLASQSLKQAVDHQLRVLRPLYLPPVTPAAAFSSCEMVQASILRVSGVGEAAHTASSSAQAPAVVEAGVQVTREFAWQAPVRNLPGVFGAMQHARDLDLSGQALPQGCIALLAQHMTRLSSLRLDACQLQESDLCSLAAFACGAGRAEALGAGGLSRLSLAGTRVSPVSTEAAAGQADRKRAIAAAALAAIARHRKRVLSATGAAQEEARPVLEAVAANPLSHLDLSASMSLDLADATCQIHRVASSAHPPAALSLLGRCSLLAPLASSLVSLRVLGNSFDAQDWTLHICNRLTLLTELHMSWDSEDARLSLDAQVFGSISQLQRLQNLRVDFKDPRGLTYEPYTLAPLARTLTALQLSATNSLPLLLSVTECTNIQSLALQHIHGVAGTPEMVVQLACSLPVLQELHLYNIQSPELQRTGMCHLGDYLLSQIGSCAPQLTKLVMPDVDVTGTGIRQAATSGRLAPLTAAIGPPAALPLGLPSAASTAAAAAPGSSSSSSTGPGGGLEGAWGRNPSGSQLGGLQQLEMDASCLMASTLPHMSCLTGLHSLTLRRMRAATFTQVCRFDCFRFVSALTRLTALNIVSRPPRVPAHGPQGGLQGGLGGLGLNNPMAWAMPQQFDEDEDGFGEDGFGEEGGGDGDDDEFEEGWDVDAADLEGSSDDAGLASDGDDEMAWQDAEEQGEQGGQGAGAVPEAAPPAAAAAAQPPQQQQQQQLDHAQWQALLQQPVPVHGAAPPQQQGPGAAAVGAAGGGLQALVQQVLGDFAAENDAAVLLGQMHDLFAGVPPEHNLLSQQLMAHMLELQLTRPPGPILEPHLHFLGRLRGLVSLNLGCLRTKGPCLMHLSSLTNLQTLLLSGSIRLSLSSLQLLQRLRLPSVRQLSLTGCSVEDWEGCPPIPTEEQLRAKLQRLAAAAGAPAAAAAVTAAAAPTPAPSAAGPAAAAAAAGAAPSASSSGGSCSAGGEHGDDPAAAWYLWQREQLYCFNRLVPVLCGAFAGVQDLRLGDCSKLSIVGLAELLQRLPKLQRLWLVGSKARGSGREGHAPVNFVPANPTAQQQHQQQQLPAAGYVLPYCSLMAALGPEHAGSLQVPQSAEDLAWFVQHGVVVEPNACRDPAGAAASTRGGPPAGGVPEGAVRLPCAAVSGLKYVRIDTCGGPSGPDHRFVRYLDRMVRW